jgi:lauroyl/myristoyl acyltransferase
MTILHRLARYRNQSVYVIIYPLFRITAFLARRLPRRLEYRLAEPVGLLVYFVWRQKRRIVHHNCAHILRRPPADGAVARTARAVFRNYAHNIVDLLRYSQLSESDLERLMLVNGVENLEAALQRGRGAILAFCHFGAWEMGGTVLTLLTPAPVNGLAETAGFAWASQFMQKQRHGHHVQVIAVETALRAVFRALANNEVVALAIDRRVDNHGVSVVFCGHPTSIPMGAASLAARTRAPILPVAFYRLPDGRYCGVIEAPIEPPPSANREALIACMSQATAALEKYVLAHPDQYFKFQPMW